MLPADIPTMKAKSIHCIAALGLGLALGQAADPVRERVAKRVTDTFAAWLGKGALIKRQPTMGGEDYGMYGRTKHKVPTFMLALGTVPTDLIRRFRATGKPLPMVHSSTYASDIEPTLRTATTAAALELLKK